MDTRPVGSMHLISRKPRGVIPGRLRSVALSVSRPFIVGKKLQDRVGTASGLDSDVSSQILSGIAAIRDLGLKFRLRVAQSDGVVVGIRLSPFVAPSLLLVEFGFRYLYGRWFWKLGLHQSATSIL